LIAADQRAGPIEYSDVQPHVISVQQRFDGMIADAIDFAANASELQSQPAANLQAADLPVFDAAVTLRDLDDWLDVRGKGVTLPECPVDVTKLTDDRKH
jgi:hypothetical protein